MNWASIAKGDNIIKQTKSSLREENNFKKLNSLNTIIKNNIPKEKETVTRDSILNGQIFKNKPITNYNLKETFDDRLYNNYQKQVFSDYNQLSSLDCGKTLNFFMSFSKPVDFDHLSK